MKKYAVLDDNLKVTNIIVAASLEIAELATSSYCILISLGTFVDIGYVYTDGNFVAPEIEAPTEETPA